MRLRVKPQDKQNYTIVEAGTMYICFSYSTPIAMRWKDKIYIDEEYYDYSNTTGKHRNDFLRETLAETRKKIDRGIYIVVKDLQKFIDENM